MKKYGKIQIEEAFMTKNPEIINVRLTQEVTDPSQNPIGACLGTLKARKISHVQAFGKSVLEAAGVRFEAKEENGKTRHYVIGSKTLEDVLGSGAADLCLLAIESTSPYYEGQEPKINPSTGAVVTHNGQPIYRSTKLGKMGDAEELLSNDRVAVAQESSDLAN